MSVREGTGKPGPATQGTGSGLRFSGPRDGLGPRDPEMDLQRQAPGAKLIFTRVIPAVLTQQEEEGSHVSDVR